MIVWQLSEYCRVFALFFDWMIKIRKRHLFPKLHSLNCLTVNLVPGGCGPFAKHQESRDLIEADFLRMCRVFIFDCQPIRFERKSVNRGLSILNRPEVTVLRANQMPRGLWGRECFDSWTIYLLRVRHFDFLINSAWIVWRYNITRRT